MAGVTRQMVPGGRFDACPWRHHVTESSYIKSSAKHPNRSTVKTLPEPWSVVRVPRFELRAPNALSPVAWTTLRGPMIPAPGTRCPDIGWRLPGLVAGFEIDWLGGLFIVFRHSNLSGLRRNCQSPREATPFILGTKNAKIPKLNHLGNRSCCVAASSVWLFLPTYASNVNCPSKPDIRLFNSARNADTTSWGISRTFK